jgi:hypothetical protein
MICSKNIRATHEQFDVEGRLNWPEMQRMLMGESVTVGNGLLVRSFVKDYKLVPLAYQLIEREQLDESQDRPATPGQNKIVGGIEFNAANRTVAYHIYLDHPQEMFGIGQSALLGGGATLAIGSRRQRIPAERVIDLALFHRPSASLGVSWLDAVGPIDLGPRLLHGQRDPVGRDRCGFCVCRQAQRCREIGRTRFRRRPRR